MLRAWGIELQEARVTQCLVQIVYIRSRLKRRASTEALIGTIKNVYLKGKIRAKGFASQHRLIGQAILTHNLKKLLSFTLSKRAKIPILQAA